MLFSASFKSQDNSAFRLSLVSRYFLIWNAICSDRMLVLHFVVADFYFYVLLYPHNSYCPVFVYYVYKTPLYFEPYPRRCSRILFCPHSCSCFVFVVCSCSCSCSVWLCSYVDMCCATFPWLCCIYVCGYSLVYVKHALCVCVCV